MGSIKKIKLVLFDLDGVLVKTKKAHFDALNSALKIYGENFIISENDHLIKFDGLSTRNKLKILTEERGLPSTAHDDIWNLKQKITESLLLDIKRSNQIVDLFSHLKRAGFKIGVCSNAIMNTVETVLRNLEIKNYLDICLSNDDVKNPKPHPEIYNKAMSELQVLPENTVIVEDSPNGLKAAYNSCANVIRVDSPEDLYISKIMNEINSLADEFPKIKWKDKNLNILIPMAGNGSRFSDAGYKDPKPLIDVEGTPMIKVVADSIGINGNFIFITKQSHAEQYNLETVLPLIAPNCKMVKIGDETTEGAACTVLLAEHLIDNDNPLIIANSDQYVKYNHMDFIYKAVEQGVDGSILTFKATDPKWSYAKVEDGLVTEVAEKNPISDNATVGIYYYKRGSDFVKYAKRMIDKNIRVNNEFYVCPVFNEFIDDGKRVTIFEAEEMWGIGTPEDLNKFLNRDK